MTKSGPRTDPHGDDRAGKKADYRKKQALAEDEAMDAAVRRSIEHYGA